MSSEIIPYLQQILPGQPDAWYQRIAREIDSGRMPMPSYGGASPQPVPDPVRSPRQPPKVEQKHRVEVFAPAKATFYKRDTSVSSATRSKLAGLCSDRGTVARLLENARNRNPEKSEQWVWDKVVWDLERDRL